MLCLATMLMSDNVDVVGSVEEMPFSDNEFDSILSTQVLEHVEYPEKAASEMCRVLKEGGHVLATVPQWNELHEEPHDFWRYTCFGMKSLFERNGFKVIAFEQTGGFFCNRAKMSMRYLVDRFDLYNKSWSRLISLSFHVWSKTAIWLDAHDRSAANRKHTIGWIFVFQKIKK
jgi:ubiquinone/menaquinone biosynthesis C-methylase UbiE